MSVLQFLAISCWSRLASSAECTGPSCDAAWSSGTQFIQTRHSAGVTRSKRCDYDDRLSPLMNMKKALEEKLEGTSYTSEELAVMKEKARAALSDVLRTDGIDDLKEYFDGYMSGFAEALAPAVSQHMVDEINAGDAPWSAGKTSCNSGMTLEEFRSKLGAIMQRVDPEDSLSLLAKHKESMNSVPATFVAEEAWPDCANVFAHRRDQGNCGSCWAMAGAGAGETRLCIATVAKFTGWLSGGYLTSCNPPSSMRGTSDGCDGGYADAGFKLLNDGGMPTGSNNNPAEGCVPYFGSGDYADHWNSRSGAPECPSDCTHDPYTVPLPEDLYFGTGVNPTNTENIQVAKSEIVQYGPIVMAYTVYEDFMAYTSGVYTHVYGSYQGGHAVMCTGYGESGGTQYLQCTNSWGSDWGENGCFKIKWGECDMYYTIGYLAAEQPALGGGPDAPATPAPTPEPTPEPTSEPAPLGCCGDYCVTSSDCADKLFCCGGHNMCMDSRTYSTIGRNCRNCD